MRQEVHENSISFKKKKHFIGSNDYYSATPATGFQSFRTVQRQIIPLNRHFLVIFQIYDPVKPLTIRYNYICRIAIMLHECANGIYIMGTPTRKTELLRGKQLFCGL